MSADRRCEPGKRRIRGASISNGSPKSNGCARSPIEHAEERRLTAPRADTVRESGIAKTAATEAWADPTHASCAAVPAPAVTSASCRTPPDSKERNTRSTSQTRERWGDRSGKVLLTQVDASETDREQERPCCYLHPRRSAAIRIRFEPCEFRSTSQSTYSLLQEAPAFTDSHATHTPTYLLWELPVLQHLCQSRLLSSSRFLGR